MKTRQEIKAIGKQSFTANYWNCVLAGIVVTVILGVISGIGNLGSTTYISEGSYQYQSGPLSGVMAIVSLVITGPLSVGLCSFFLQNLYGKRDVSPLEPVLSCQDGFVRKMAGYLWMMLFVLLWSLALIIPGLIKGLSYGMTQYILADCPNVQPRDALKISERMMSGHKMDLFVTFLSFIGWGLLTIITFGIVGLFYAGPYLNSTIACWYLECRDDALRRGAITLGQLQGVEPVL